MFISISKRQEKNLQYEAGLNMTDVVYIGYHVGASLSENDIITHSDKTVLLILSVKILLNLCFYICLYFAIFDV